MSRRPDADFGFARLGADLKAAAIDLGYALLGLLILVGIVAFGIVGMAVWPDMTHGWPLAMMFVAAAWMTLRKHMAD